MFTKFVSKKIQETLNAKERVLARKNNGNFTDNPSANSYKSLKDISSRTPFVRMISNKKDVENIVISGGVRNPDGTMKHGFKKSGEGAYYNTKVDGESQSGIRPIAGIRDVEISYKGGFKAIRETVVNWTVGSLEELDRMTPYFLTVGKTVMVDWGWCNSNKSIEQQFGSTYYRDGKVDSKLFTDTQSKILNIGGNYGAIGGVISNFEYQLRQDGGFDCVTKIVSMGANLFKKPVDKGLSQKHLVGVKTSENKVAAKPSPMDSLLDTLVNLQEYIIDTLFVDLSTTKFNDAGYRKQTLLGNQKMEEYLVETALEKIDSGNANYTTIWRSEKSPSTATQFEVNGALIVDKTQNVLWYGISGGQTDINISGDTIYVTWGWFEDNILSRYTGYVSDDDEVKLTVRSIDTVLENGAPVKNVIEGSDFATQEAQEMVQIAELGYLATENKKKLSEIGNHPFLYGKNPEKFLLPGQNPAIEKFTVTKAGAKATNLFYATDKSWKSVYAPLEALLNFVPQTGGEERRFEKAGSNRKRGYLRNILIDIREIQKAFGIDASKGTVINKNQRGWFSKTLNSKTIAIGDLRPPANIEAGITNLLNQLNDNFFNIWDFRLTSDPYDSTNIKVLDQKMGVPDKTVYTFFDSKSGNIGGSEGIYKFPSFKMGSTVKSQELSFKIPNAMALTAMYGSNKILKSLDDDTQHDNSDMMAVFGKDLSSEYEDNYLSNLEPISKKDGWGFTDGVANRVGSFAALPNSKIVRNGDGLKVNSNAKWTPVKIDMNATPKARIPAVSNDSNTSIPVYAYLDSIGDYGDIIDTTHWLRADGESDYNLGFDGAGIGGPPLVLQAEYVKKESFKDYQNPPYYHSNSEIKMHSMGTDVQSVISAVINGSFDNARKREGVYRTDFIIPAELSLEIDGIEGLLPGDIIQTDYIQKKYNKSVVVNEENLGPFTYFQIFGISHKISPSGWTTEISTKMRTNGDVLNADSAAVVDELSSDTLDKTISETPTNNTEVLEVATEQEVETLITEQDESGVEPTYDEAMNKAKLMQEIGLPLPPTLTETNTLDSSDMADEEFDSIVIENSVAADNTNTAGIPLWYTPAGGTQTLNLTGPRGVDSVYNPSDFIIRDLTDTGLNSVESDNTNVSLDAMGFVSLPPSLTGQNADTGNLTVSEGQGPDGQEIKQDSNGAMYYAEGTEEATTAVRDWIRGVNMKVDKSGDVKQIETHHDSKKEAVLKNNLLEISGNSEIAQVAIGDPGTTPDPGDEAFIGPMMAPVTVEEVVGGLMSPEEVEKKQDAVADGENLQILADEVARKEELARLAAEVAELDRRKEQAKADNELYKEIIKIGEWVSTGKSDLEGAANLRADGNKLPALFQKLGREQIPLPLGIGFITIELRGTQIFEYNEDDPEPRYLYEKTWGVVDDRETKLFIMYPELRD